MGVANYKTSKQNNIQMKGILPDAEELGKAVRIIFVIPALVFHSIFVASQSFHQLVRIPS